MQEPFIPFTHARVLTQSILASFTPFCTIHVDLSNATKDLVRKQTSGRVYYQLDYDVVVFFGLTSLEAYLAKKTEVNSDPPHPAVC